MQRGFIAGANAKWASGALPDIKAGTGTGFMLYRGKRHGRLRALLGGELSDPLVVADEGKVKLSSWIELQRGSEQRYADRLTATGRTSVPALALKALMTSYGPQIRRHGTETHNLYAPGCSM